MARITVYELIQDLVQYKPDTEVEFKVSGNIEHDIEVNVDLNGYVEQEFSVDCEVDNKATFEDITDNENREGKIILNIEI